MPITSSQPAQPKGFIQVPAMPNNPGTSNSRPMLIAVDAIATVSEYGPHKTRVVLKTLRSAGDDIVTNDTVIVDLTYADVISAMNRAM